MEADEEQALEVHQVAEQMIEPEQLEYFQPDVHEPVEVLDLTRDDDVHDVETLNFSSREQINAFINTHFRILHRNLRRLTTIAYVDIDCDYVMMRYFGPNYLSGEVVQITDRNHTIHVLNSLTQFFMIAMRIDIELRRMSFRIITSISHPIILTRNSNYVYRRYNLLLAVVPRNLRNYLFQERLEAAIAGTETNISFNNHEIFYLILAQNRLSYQRKYIIAWRIHKPTLK